MKIILLALILLPFSAFAQTEKPTSANESVPKSATPVATQNSKLETQNSTRAVVVGISDYQDAAIPDLRFAHRDAEAFAAWLQSPDGGSIAPGNLILLTNQNATIGKMAGAIDWLLEASQPGDNAVLYFSGHGDVESKTVRNLGFLLTYNTPSNSYIAGAYPVFYLQTVMETLSQKGVQVIMIADACHAGKLAGNEINGSGITALSLATQFAKEVKIMSCQSNEFSLEGEQWGGGRGAFSYHLVEGLQGLADADANLQVNLREIGRYLEDQVSKETAPHKQMPYTVGDAYRLLASVNANTLAALKEKKMQPMPALQKVEIKSLAEMLLEPLDSTIQNIYQRFHEALLAGDLLEPKDSCAYDLYLRLAQVDSLNALHGLMRRNLAAAFQDDAQQAINACLRADTSEINAYRRKDKRFLQYPTYLEKAAELLGPEHYAYRSIISKKYYFQGLNQLYDVQDLNKRDSLGREGLRFLLKALEHEDKAPYIYNALGNFYNQLRDSSQSIAHWDKAIQLAPGWITPWVAKGYFYWHGYRQCAEAEVCFKRALELDSTHVEVLSGLGRIYQYCLGMPEKAELLFNRVLSLDSSDLIVPLNLARLKADKKDLKGAITIIKRHLKWHPEYSEYYSFLGMFYTGEGQLDSAELFHEKACMLGPSVVTSYPRLAWIKLQLGKEDEATALFRKLLTIDSTLNWSWYQTGRYYQVIGYWEKAKTCYRRSLELNPQDFRATVGLARLETAQGNYDLAITTLEKGLRWRYLDFEYEYELGVALKNSGRFDQALPHLREAVANRPLCFDCLYGVAEIHLAAIYLHAGNAPAADSLFQKVLSSLSDSVDHIELYNYGRAQLELSNREAMKSACIELAKKHPHDGEIAYAIARLFALADFGEEALPWLEKAIQSGIAFYGKVLANVDFATIRGNPKFKDLMKKYFPDKVTD